MQISVYKNKNDNKGAVLDLIAVLRSVKKGAYREQIRALRDMDKDEYDIQKGLILPAATFSGIFAPTRHNDNCTSYTRLLTLDIDHVADRLDELRDLITADSHTYCCFISPSGAGLKVLIPVTSDKEHHRAAFECARLYYKDHFGVDLDVSGKNEARLCYLGFDPDMHFNGEAVPLPVVIDEATARKVYADRDLKMAGFALAKDDDEKYRVAKDWAEYNKPYRDRNRNNHIHVCSCNLNRVGVSAENAILLIARDRTDMPIEEIKETVRKAYKANAHEWKTQTVYEFEQDQDMRRGMLDFDTPESLLESIASSPSKELVPTGFPKRDSIFGGGYLRGSAYLYVGRDKTYKSIDAIRTACFNARHERPVIYWNGEMSKLQIMQIIAQQEMSIPRIEFQSRFNDVVAYFKANLKRLLIVTGSSFTKDQIEKTYKSAEQHIKEPAWLMVLDGLKQMAAKNKESILSMIENAEVAKEIAKSTNTAVIALIHTDANTKYWDRNPRDFVLGKTQVTRNFDGCIGFSRFVEEGTMSEDGRMYELRKDVYHVRLQDDRFTGDTANVVMNIDALTAVPTESNDDPFIYEYNQTSSTKHAF